MYGTPMQVCIKDGLLLHGVSYHKECSEHVCMYVCMYVRTYVCTTDLLTRLGLEDKMVDTKRERPTTVEQQAKSVTAR